MKLKNRVICCGNIGYDLVPKAGSSKAAYVFEAFPGGSVLNTALMLARLGLNITVLSKTGTDPMGSTLIKTLKKDKIDTSRISQDKKVTTSLAMASLDEHGNSTYTFYKTHGSVNKFSKNIFTPSLFRGVSFFHTGSAYSYNKHTFDDTLKLMSLAKKEGTLISYDPNWRDNRISDKKNTRIRIKKLLELTDLLKLSDTDAMGISGTRTLSSALSKLGSGIIVTLGERGSFYWTGKKRIFCPAFKVAVADTIGAGDAFIAGLIYHFCHYGRDLFFEKIHLSLRFASAVSAIICTGRGSTASFKGLHQTELFLKKNRQ